MEGGCGWDKYPSVVYTTKYQVDAVFCGHKSIESLSGVSVTILSMGKNSPLVAPFLLLYFKKVIDQNKRKALGDKGWKDRFGKLISTD